MKKFFKVAAAVLIGTTALSGSFAAKKEAKAKPAKEAKAKPAKAMKIKKIKYDEAGYKAAWEAKDYATCLGMDG